MSEDRTTELAAKDKTYLWHPFTPMTDWMAPEHEPLIIEEGRGAMVIDSRGREYLDGNSTIWTNIHGHNHPHITRAIQRQAEKIAHVSFLGSTNSVSINLAEKLVGLFPPNTLSRVFYSDDGSTAVEAGLRMALQYFQQNGEAERSKFLSFDQAYHGDTLGAASVGGIGSFHGAVQRAGFPTVRVRNLAEFREMMQEHAKTLAGVVIEPLIQGAAGMQVWPEGMLPHLRHWCEQTGAFLIFDEVMTGFGRTGTMFAGEREGVTPDILALAKGLSGGTLPLAATLVNERIFEGFLGPVETMRTFYYGHSYTGNPLGCAAALANLEVFEREQTLEKLQPKIRHMTQLLCTLAENPHITLPRQCGFICAFDLVDSTGSPYPFGAQQGARVCLAARKHGLLTRGRGNAVFLLPPLVTSEEQLDHAFQALQLAIEEVCD
jgi:adenosylmethionine-8-amino-7-oxononanoate aminotransferase